MKLKDILSEAISPKSGYLYHATSVENLGSIKNYGLIPKFGDLVKSTEAWSHWQNTVKRQAGSWNDVDEIEGIIFFREEPHVGFQDVSKDIGKEEILNDILLAVVEKNGTIYKKTTSGKILDYEGNEVRAVEFGRRLQYQVDVDSLPLFIERGDWFTFTGQDPVELLHGQELYDFLKDNFSERI